MLVYRDVVGSSKGLFLCGSRKKSQNNGEKNMKKICIGIGLFSLCVVAHPEQVVLVVPQVQAREVQQILNLEERVHVERVHVVTRIGDGNRVAPIGDMDLNSLINLRKDKLLNRPVDTNQATPGSIAKVATEIGKIPGIMEIRSSDQQFLDSMKEHNGAGRQILNQGLAIRNVGQIRG